MDLSSASVAALLELQGNLLSELRRRKVVRSANNPTGDYGELLFSRAFGWALSQNSCTDADATDASGLRYQIKCRRVSESAGSRQLGIIRRLPDRPFDRLAAVLLDGRFRVLRGAVIPYEIVQQRATYNAKVNGWRFMLQDIVWRLPGVLDVTANLRTAAQDI